MIPIILTPILIFMSAPTGALISTAVPTLAPIVASVSTLTPTPELIPAMPYTVPLFSQISDISSPEWKQKGCGVADIAMIIEFYKPNTTSVDKVLEEAIKGGAYVKNVGWSHAGLAALAQKHGMIGKTYSFSGLTKADAFSQFEDIIKEGPAIASIHRGFNPKSSYGHLIVVTGFDDNLVYYNDPGKHDGIRKISIDQFMNGWKRSLIVIRTPVSESKTQIALAL